MSINADEPDESEWKEIILRLSAFARSWTKGKPWFRGEETTTFSAGKQAEDYALEAICRYLEGPKKYDSKKGDLLEYLKYNLVRTFIGNDLRKKENTSTSDIFAKDDIQHDGEDDSSPYSERIMPYTAALFPDDIDYATIKTYIENEVKGDSDAENILLGVYTLGMKRRDIISEFEMTPAAYDNGMRRLNTAINRASTHFSEKRHTA